MLRCHAGPRASSKSRRVALLVDRLEIREVLSTASATGFLARPMFEVSPFASAPPGSSYTPAQVRQAYGFDQIGFGSVQGDGTGQTIAIVDAYDDPNIQADLDIFSAQFGLPRSTVTRVDQTGGTAYPATDPTGGWEMEIALDVEWAHAMAPGANILLVEARSPTDSDLLPAVSYAAAHADVVSLSWGGGEFSTETFYDSYFSRPGVAFVAASGDRGAPVSWPAVSSDVLAVGGTTLTLSGGTYAGESAWSGSGGGPSAYVSQPAYQGGVVTQTTRRANPDVAYDANPSTGFAVYDSFPYNGVNPEWVQVGGTSAGAPQWAALLAIADQGRALNGLAPLNSTSPQEVMTLLYQNATSGMFHDITSGTSTGNPNYTAVAGYDYVTGIGSPAANLVVSALIGVPTPTSNDTLTINTPAGATAGSAFSITVSALDPSGAVDANYTGTVRFSSSDAQAVLPGSYTFTAADAGTHTFLVTLGTAGSQSVTATDTASGQTATGPGIAVSPAAASQFILTGLPSTTTVGAPMTFTVTAKDPYGNVATGYTGTVRFSSSDAGASLPADSTFTTADAGVHTFGMQFGTAGTQSVSVNDDASGITVTQGSITVNPAAPVNLAATAVSSTQINLSWTGSAGATGYAIGRSANGGSSWTIIATTPAGTTTYVDVGLAGGTTYSYRVRATGGNGSDYSNTATATTTGSPTTSPTSTLWADSYTPPENAYSFGWYELGVRFQADVAGTITGVRFYKQTWMDGFTHVGHLWSSTGTLLATVRFTGETGWGWQQANFSTPVSITPGTTYLVSFSTGGGFFGVTTNYFTSAGYGSGSLHALPNGAGSVNGVYGRGGSFPTASGNGMNFWVDPVFSASVTAASTSPRSVTPATPAAGTLMATPAVAVSTAAASSPVVGVPASTRPVETRKSTPVSSPSRRTVPQALNLSSAGRRRGWVSEVG